MHYFFMSCALCFTFAIQAQLDTIYHPNGKIKLIQSWKSEWGVRDGLYREYDSLGVLIEQGLLQATEKVSCKNCYFQSNGKFEQTDEFLHVPLKKGVWKTYYPNGKLKASGCYSDKVHVYAGEELQTDEDRFPKWIFTNYDDLKHGTWSYYKETGEILMLEEYIDGDLIFRKKYK